MRARGLLASAAALTLLLVAACGAGQGSRLPTFSRADSIELRSPAFGERQAIPPRYTCGGADVSPPLGWSGGPPAEEFALFMTDPDASGGEFVHWVVYGIPGGVSSLPEGGLPLEAKAGTNDFHATGYGGPCPPQGDPPHRYVFTLYALRTARGASIPSGSEPEQVIEAIRCCIEARGTLTGTYGR